VTDRSTIYEVAKRSGVSTATVSRVMAEGKGFSPATRERVQAMAAELGWVPSGPARGLASRRAGVVGLLFPDLGQSGAAEEESPLYVDQVIRGAERAATSVGDAVLIAATRGASGRQLAFSVAGKADGLVVMARSLSDDNLVISERRYQHRVGQTYAITFNPNHKWFWFPRMRRDEAIVFKVFDSEKDGRARWTAHTAFDDPTSPPHARPRESIEIRTLAFF